MRDDAELVTALRRGDETAGPPGALGEEQDIQGLVAQTYVARAASGPGQRGGQRAPPKPTSSAPPCSWNLVARASV